MNSTIAILKLKATKDDYQILGEVLITKDKEYDAVRADGLVLISDDITFVRTVDTDGNIEGFDIISTEEVKSISDITIDSIADILKNKQIERWVDENISPSSIKLVTFTDNCRLYNNASYLSGAEYFNKNEVYVGLVSPSGDLMIQKRKGVVFYLSDSSAPLEIKEYGEIKGHTYTILKEIKFMYENDHKRS